MAAVQPRHSRAMAWTRARPWRACALDAWRAFQILLILKKAGTLKYYEISFHLQTTTERKGEVISFYVLLSFYPLMRRFSFLHHYERKCGFFFFDYCLSSIPLILYYLYTGYLNILVLLQRFRESKECINFFYTYINIS